MVSRLRTVSVSDEMELPVQRRGSEEAGSWWRWQASVEGGGSREKTIPMVVVS